MGLIDQAVINTPCFTSVTARGASVSSRAQFDFIRFPALVNGIHPARETGVILNFQNAFRRLPDRLWRSFRTSDQNESKRAQCDDKEDDRGEKVSLFSQGECQFSDMLVAFILILLQGLTNDLIEALRASPLALRRLGKMTGGELPGENFVKDDSDRINVGTVINDGVLLELFGSHILRGADRDLGPGQSPIVLRMAGGLGKAEVHDPHHACFLKENIGRFDIAMHDAVAMGIGQGCTQLFEQ